MTSHHNYKWQLYIFVVNVNWVCECKFYLLHLCITFWNWVQVSTALSTTVENQKRPSFFAPFKMQKKNPSGKMKNYNARASLQKVKISESENIQLQNSEVTF